MTPVSPKNSQTDKQRAKFDRQRCINLLEKITKNLFRSFRSKTTTKEQVIKRFSKLKKLLDHFSKVHLDSPYHREMRNYIDQFAKMIAEDFDLDAIRDKQMTRLNRIQKIKNATAYKKDKHTKKLSG